MHFEHPRRGKACERLPSTSPGTPLCHILPSQSITLIPLYPCLCSHNQTLSPQLIVFPRNIPHFIWAPITTTVYLLSPLPLLSSPRSLLHKLSAIPIFQSTDSLHPLSICTWVLYCTKLLLAFAHYHPVAPSFSTTPTLFESTPIACHSFQQSHSSKMFFGYLLYRYRQAKDATIHQCPTPTTRSINTSPPQAPTFHQELLSQLIDSSSEPHHLSDPFNPLP